MVDSKRSKDFRICFACSMNTENTTNYSNTTASFVINGLADKGLLLAAFASMNLNGLQKYSKKELNNKTQPFIDETCIKETIVLQWLKLSTGKSISSLFFSCVSY